MISVGDILLTINGVNVLDLPHTQVVRVAQKCEFYHDDDGYDDNHDDYDDKLDDFDHNHDDKHDDRDQNHDEQ